MPATVLTFHITYTGLESRIWRDVEVSSRYRLDRLGYLVLATFDTMAYHLFEIRFREKTYGLPQEAFGGPRIVGPKEPLDLKEFTVGDLAPEIGESLEMVYDFGTEQHFLLTLTAVRPMKRGEGTHYPFVTAMSGRGILDDVPVWELEELIGQIDRNGQTDEPLYYDRHGVDPDRLPRPWDVNWFDLNAENILLKGEINWVEGAYAPFRERR